MKEKDFLRAVNLCVRCGSCIAQCPTYKATDRETENARGRLKILKSFAERHLAPGGKVNEKIFNCIMCGNCTNRCPIGIDIEEVFYHARSLLKSYDKKMGIYRLATRMAFKNTDFTVKMLKPFQKYINRKMGEKKLIPGNIGFNENQFKKTGVFKPMEKIGRVAIFSGCSVKHVYPELSQSLTKVLNALKYEVVFPRPENCCGAPFRSLGMEDVAKEYAEKNYDTFSKLNLDAILSLCPTCVVYLKNHYPKLIGKKLENVFEVSVFLRDKVKDIKKEIKIRAAYHDPCHQANVLKATTEPRELLKMSGVELLEPKNQTCCGFGGTFSFFFQEMSGKILETTTRELKDTGCEAIVTSCPNCLLQLSKSMTDRPIYHIIEVLEEAICESVGT